jgi:hypothetical protein
MQAWNPPETAPTNGKAIRALVGSDLREVVVQWDGERWAQLAASAVFYSIEGWLPRQTSGGDLRDAGGTGHVFKLQ